LGSTISIITRIEVLGWQGHTEQSLIATKDLLSLFEEISLHPAIADCCIQIRKTFRIKLPDAIIAATALVQKQALMSRNADDFAKVSGVTLFNPFPD
jgi:hypothetical protein